MKEIFEQYGGAAITALAIASLATFITMVVGTNSSSPVYIAFNNLLSTMGSHVH